MRNAIRLGALSLVHAIFVSANVYFISVFLPVAVFACTLISTVMFTFNMRNAILGSNLDRYVYSIGAAMGCTLGVVSSHAIHNLLR